ncbi:leucyl/phenylalanyl-tRNA--protein transferase [Calidifontibacter sp. DB0510]|uniref:Leucyl/phenylalanyl-tRNA--protein transferase n=1 Tax=Metallococcus carri TaxID=1656884 RepID=A0A967B5G1_9MICO|nr:leucyl/phenylalanyl-tRNA--protein transferase [Metallococcus carri]NHN55962.1 leucyl/phenylalanyl-tRNA--protein transferase [Metallococcus carri]NOP37581.1 leucyl/phenylalanyl-tRNA--protein transferase [Calidifontibacter sp. DB2511S]
MPVEPPPSPYNLDLDLGRVRGDLAGVGADLAPGTLLAAYRRGLFPMGLGHDGVPPYGWYSPERRGVLLAGDHHVSRSLRRSARRFSVSVDDDFEAVMVACADPSRDGRWITREIIGAYAELHRLGWAHSVEVRDGDDRLVGGLYGVAIGGLFAGESMFHIATDASKVALWALVEIVFSGPAATDRLIDVQWQTDHLARQGVREVPRSAYLGLLDTALRAPAPEPFADTRT